MPVTWGLETYRFYQGCWYFLFEDPDIQLELCPRTVYVQKATHEIPNRTSPVVWKRKISWNITLCNVVSRPTWMFDLTELMEIVRAHRVFARVRCSRRRSKDQIQFSEPWRTVLFHRRVNFPLNTLADKRHLKILWQINVSLEKTRQIFFTWVLWWHL